jgi:Mn-dependent DtxR family transcriptional regulator
MAIFIKSELFEELDMELSGVIMQAFWIKEPITTANVSKYASDKPKSIKKCLEKLAEKGYLTREKSVYFLTDKTKNLFEVTE